MTLRFIYSICTILSLATIFVDTSHLAGWVPLLYLWWQSILDLFSHFDLFVLLSLLPISFLAIFSITNNRVLQWPLGIISYVLIWIGLFYVIDIKTQWLSLIPFLIFTLSFLFLMKFKVFKFKQKQAN